MKHPNIILITTDQQRYDTSGEGKPPFLRMPHTDILANEGINFTNAYSQCPLCAPARLSIMTGMYPQTLGMLNNGITANYMGKTETLPAILRNVGYQTYAVGKMHFNPYRSRHGFDEILLPEDYYIEMREKGIEQPMRHGLGQNEYYPTLSTVKEENSLTNWISKKCQEFILERRDPTSPFFLWCSFSKPHPPLDPPEPYYSMYRGKEMPQTRIGEWRTNNCPEAFKRHIEKWNSDKISKDILNEAKSAYYGLLTQIDYNIGLIYSALNDIGIYEDTIFLYTSDHGEYLGDQGCTGKFFFHEQSAHIPFILRLPQNNDNIYKGIKIDYPITHADIMPTILSLAGIECDKKMDGIDLTSLLKNKLIKPKDSVKLNCNTFTDNNKEAYNISYSTLINDLSNGINKNKENSYHFFDNERFIEGISTEHGREFIGITNGKIKYIWYPEGEFEQLFHLEKDPYELNDLSKNKEYFEIKYKLASILSKSPYAEKYQFSKNGILCGYSIKKDTELERRASKNAGLHSVFLKEDIKH